LLFEIKTYPGSGEKRFFIKDKHHIDTDVYSPQTDFSDRLL
jgi:hypothetical protein